MKVVSDTITVQTQGFNDVHDLTPDVAHSVERSGLTDGIAAVFVPGSTAGVTTIEFESGAIADLKSAISRLVPEGVHYKHDARWGDGNGFSHIRAALLGPSLTIPFSHGDLSLGTWQQVVLIDFDNRPRRREVLVQIVGS